ncbi:MAG: hypothetical protein R2762_28690 [Bryobacteraceae bacterium]
MRRFALLGVLAVSPLLAQQRFQVLFGGADAAPSDWSGEISATGGQARIVAMHHFSHTESFDATSWKAVNQWDANLNLLPQEQAQFPKARWKGVVIEVTGPDSTLVRIRTAHGEAEFRPAGIPYLATHKLMNGRLQVERVPMSQPLAGAETNDDYPAMAISPGGRVWMAWSAHKTGTETLRLRWTDDGRTWSNPFDLTPAPGDYYQTALASPADGVLLAVWSATVNGQVDLYARTLRAGAWSAVEQLTRTPGPDTFPKLAATKDGAVFLVWQSAGTSKTDISMRTWTAGRWSAETKVTEHPESDWEPALAVNSRGEAAIAWDSYRHGNYDIFLRRWSNGRLQPLERITASPDFEGHAALAYDTRDRLWIAYDNSGPNWGKDAYGINGILRGESGIYFRRRVEVRVIERGRLLEPTRPLDEKLPGKPLLGSRMTLGLPSSYETFTENPILQADRHGRMWALVRMRTIGRLSPTTRAAEGMVPYWVYQAVMFDGSAWTQPLAIPDSGGRQEQRAAFASGPGGDLWIASQTDGWNLLPSDPRYGQYDVHAVRVELDRVPGAGVDRETLAGSSGLDAPRTVADTEPAPDSPVWKTYEMKVAGKSYKLTWGDLHRHTDLSFDGQSDGSLYDLYRYATDAAKMDFIGPSEHLMPKNDISDYMWRMVDKAVDIYKLPGAFYPLLNYERTVKYPDGHRNIVGNRRGYEPIRIKAGPGPADAAEDDQPYLWKTLLGGKAKPTGLSIPHTTATQMGTDWRYNDERVERLVEIYQGNRDSYEYYGAPKGAVAHEISVGGYITSASIREKGFVWNALAKGYKMGFIASSDHRATHNSYAAVYTPERSYDGIWNSLYERRTYAATDNIVVDFQCQGHAMGEEFRAKERPRLEIGVIGTARIRQIDIIRDNTFVYTAHPGVAELSVTFADTEAAPGPHYYYVRVIQEDENMAWASPIWIDYRP